MPFYNNCKQCDKPFEVRGARANKAKYCSIACYVESRRVKTNCERCGKRFSYKPTTSTGRYCSRECYRPVVKRSCRGCSKEFITSPCRKGMYCSRKCQIFETTRLEKECIICGQKILKVPSEIDKAKFCSLPCYRENQWQGMTTHEKDLRAGRRRYERMKKSEGKYGVKEWRQKFLYFGHSCYLCGTALTNNNLHKDHRIPLVRGGTNWIANIAPACRRCNLAKGRMTESEYRQQITNEASSSNIYTDMTFGRG